MVTRKGFTLIELIVAIVVISIALMSVPLLLSQANKSNEFNINQEAILAGATKIGDILTYPWNESNASQTLQVFDVTQGDNNLSRYPDNTSTRRIGHFKENYRRKFYSQITQASLILGHENTNDFDDIDDFNGITESITNGGVGDYIKDFNITTTVKYIDDNATYSSSPLLNMNINTIGVTPSTNLKMVEVKVVDTTNNEHITTLRAFSANIGSYELLYRTFP